MSSQALAYNPHACQDPVVQSIVSLTISLRHKFVKQISAKLTNTLLFFAEKKKCENPLQCKGFSHFFNKNSSVFVIILVFDFKETLTNDVVSFEQLGPGAFGRLKFIS